jgi:hypothetical protein
MPAASAESSRLISAREPIALQELEETPGGKVRARLSGPLDVKETRRQLEQSIDPGTGYLPNQLIERIFARGDSIFVTFTDRVDRQWASEMLQWASGMQRVQSAFAAESFRPRARA